MDVVSTDNTRQEHPDATQIARQARVSARVRAAKKQNGNNDRLYFMKYNTYFMIR